MLPMFLLSRSFSLSTYISNFQYQSPPSPPQKEEEEKEEKRMKISGL